MPPKVYGGGFWSKTAAPFKDDVVAFPEILIECDTADVPGLLKPVFERYGMPSA
jgi:hypothetical protein